MAACLIRLVIFGYIIWLYSLVTLGYVWLRTSLHRPFDSPARLASLTHRVTQLLSCTAFMVCRLAGSSVGASNYAVWLRLVTSGYTWLHLVTPFTSSSWLQAYTFREDPKSK